jgi:hypothetical protein
LLGLSGALAQGLFRNPLADPYLLGSASGASLGVAIALALFGSNPFATEFLVRLGLTGAAFVGAVLAVFLTLVLARGVQHTLRLLLAGVIVGVVLGAVASLIGLMRPDVLQGMQGFLLGSTSFVDWNACVLMLCMLLVCGAMAWALSRVLDALSLGESTALSLGLPLVPVRLALVGVLATWAEVLKKGALAEAAQWPGTVAQKNPYFNLTLATRLEEEFHALAKSLDQGIDGLKLVAVSGTQVFAEEGCAGDRLCLDDQVSGASGCLAVTGGFEGLFQFLLLGQNRFHFSLDLSSGAVDLSGNIMQAMGILNRKVGCFQSSDSLDATNAGGDGGLTEDAEKSDLAGGAAMGACAQFHGISIEVSGAADLDDANGLAIFITEKLHDV